MPYNTNDIDVGPGTLYAAPIGTTEPTGVTGAWPAGWINLGYTDGGSTDGLQPQFADITVEEELDVIKKVATGRAATITFALAEVTARNLLLAYNAGIGSSLLASSTGVNADGSVWVEPVDPGNEVRVMIGWDQLPKGATAGADPGLHRKIFRQCLQTGNVQMAHKKGNAKTLINCAFSLEKPTGQKIWRDIFPPSAQS